MASQVPPLLVRGASPLWVAVCVCFLSLNENLSSAAAIRCVQDFPAAPCQTGEFSSLLILQLTEKTNFIKALRW